MGGDGGVIASNRRYMRGAGTADCTADRNKHAKNQSSAESAREIMTTCAISKAPLDFDSTIVACPYGRLYQREAALQALLRRKDSNTNELGSHVRNLKDLHPAKFELNHNKIPVCPVTGLELNGQVPAILLLHSKNDVNVLSERALKEIGQQELQQEYGDLQDTIRLAPPSNMMEQIQTDLIEKRQQEKISKKKKKDSKKRKHNKNDDEKKKKKSLKSLHGTNSNGGSVADAARARVATAVASNNVLSSLFTTKSSVSEKEKNDNLFARTS